MEMHKLIQNGRERVYQLRHKLATAGVAVLLCVMSYHVVFGANGLMVYRQKRREYSQLQQQIQSLQQQNGVMEQQIKAFKTDPKAIEKEARERLRYARPGEVVYTLPTTQPAPSADKK
jgi:cell division protein FtsB